jgi:hypothetical protein
MLKKFSEQVAEEKEIVTTAEELEEVQVAEETVSESKKAVKETKVKEEDEVPADETEGEDEEQMSEAKVKEEEGEEMSDDSDDEEEDEEDEEEMDETVDMTKSEILAASYKMLKTMKKEELRKGFKTLKAEFDVVADGDKDAEETAKVAESVVDIEVDVKEDVDALLSTDAELSEEFKAKAATIFEAAVQAKVADKVGQIEEQVKADFEVKLEEARVELSEKVDSYLNYVVEEWVKENAIAIEKGIRTEIAEEFMTGLRNLFVENYIDVPDEKVDLLDQIAEEKETLEAKLNEQLQTAVEMKKELDAFKAEKALQEVCEGLADTQQAKLKSLAEGVEFETLDQYREKLETIKESYFPKVRATGAEKEEGVADNIAKTENLSEAMSVYAKALSGMKK